jgi:hypothetical protein
MGLSSRFTRKTDMQTYTLTRTGLPNATFRGELQAAARSPAHQLTAETPTARNRWYEAAVYRTQGGFYVMHLRYRFSGKLHREREFDAMVTVDRVEDLFASFDDPLEFVAGYPVGDRWREQQEILEISVREDFDMLKEQIIDQLAKLEPAEKLD